MALVYMQKQYEELEKWYSSGDMMRNRDPAERTVLRIMRDACLLRRRTHRVVPETFTPARSELQLLCV